MLFHYVSCYVDLFIYFVIFFFFFFYCFIFFCFFFFFSSRRRHTRWNCDWNSDVCSSDLALHAEVKPLCFMAARRVPDEAARAVQDHQAWRAPPGGRGQEEVGRVPGRGRARRAVLGEGHVRSEERRVGKEWRCLWTPEQAG